MAIDASVQAERLFTCDVGMQTFSSSSTSHISASTQTFPEPAPLAVPTIDATTQVVVTLQDSAVQVYRVGAHRMTQTEKNSIDVSNQTQNCNTSDAVVQVGEMAFQLVGRSVQTEPLPMPPPPPLCVSAEVQVKPC